jgi:putative phosphoribosyl transferase
MSRIQTLILINDGSQRSALLPGTSSIVTEGLKPKQESVMSFMNRADAGRRLAAALAQYKVQQPVVLALPRGGVPVAVEVATVLSAPLDLILVRKIGVPYQSELAMGAIVDGNTPLVVRNDDVIAMAGVSEPDFEAVRDRELAEIERRRQQYLGDRPRAEVASRAAIVIDDGIATGATALAALRATRMRKPKKLVLAVPVAPMDTLVRMRNEADDVVCLEEYADFGAIGFYYLDFRQVSDQEVINALARCPACNAVTPSAPPTGTAEWVPDSSSQKPLNP